MGRIPRRLRRPPLVEAIWDLRFEPAVENAGEYLHGELFRLRPGERPEVQLLVPLGLPADMLAAIGWSERPVKALRWKDGLTVQFGDRVLTVNLTGSAYRGFEEFRSWIKAVLEAMPPDIAKTVRRTSLRYINLITVSSNPTLNTLFIDLTVGADHKRVTENVYLRWEETAGKDIFVYQIGAPAKTRQKVQGKDVGIAIDIDAIATDLSSVSMENLVNEVLGRVDRIHEDVKGRFFDLLRPEILEEMGPEWEGGP